MTICQRGDGRGARMAFDFGAKKIFTRVLRRNLFNSRLISNYVMSGIASALVSAVYPASETLRLSDEVPSIDNRA